MSLRPYDVCEELEKFLAYRQLKKRQSDLRSIVNREPDVYQVERPTEYIALAERLGLHPYELKLHFNAILNNFDDAMVKLIGDLILINKMRYPETTQPYEFSKAMVENRNKTAVEHHANAASSLSLVDEMLTEEFGNYDTAKVETDIREFWLNFVKDIVEYSKSKRGMIDEFESPYLEIIKLIDRHSKHVCVRKDIKQVLINDDKLGQIKFEHILAILRDLVWKGLVK